MLGLGDLTGGCVDGRAFDASADGSVIVGQSNAEFGDEAFIWDEVLGMRNLSDVLVDDFGLAEVADWVLREARAVSDDRRWPPARRESLLQLRESPVRSAIRQFHPP